VVLVTRMVRVGALKVQHVYRLAFDDHSHAATPLECVSAPKNLDCQHRPGPQILPKPILNLSSLTLVTWRKLNASTHLA
jgi:hypothetical protein